MELKLVTGRAKTGKSTYLYNDALSKLNSNTGTNLLYVVPEQMTYSTELEIINKTNDAGLLDLQITSFKKLEYMVFDEVGGLKLADINDYGKIMLLKQICDKSIDELKVYKKALYKDGFLREFNSFVKELKKNNINTKKLEEINLDGIKNELLKRKLSDIIMIYRNMESMTKDNFFDDEDKTDYFVEIIEKSNIIKNSYIYIDNFESLIGQRLRVIKKLVEHSKGVMIALNIDNNCLGYLESIDDYEIFKVTYDTLRQYEKIAEELNLKIDYVKLEKSYISNCEIKAIEDNMFKISSKHFTQDLKNVHVSSSMNNYTEIENVCKIITTLVRDKGYRYKDIAVVTAGMDMYEVNIKKVFTKFEIPYFMDVKKDIMNNPFVKYILSILDMLNYNFKHQSVFEYFKTGFSGLDFGEVDKLENFALEYGIEGNRWFRKFTMNHIDVDYYENLRKKFAKDFSSLRKEFKNLKTSEDITIFLYNIFKKHKIQEKIIQKVDEFKHTGRYELSFINTQVWNVIIDIFEQIILTSKDVEISTIQYRKILESGLMEIELGIIPPTLDKVVVGDLDRAFINSYKTIFLVGANEGVLLSFNSDKGLLLDEEKESLTKLGLSLLNTSMYNNFKDKHILYKVLTKPTENLYISYALSTVDGKALQPSLYIDKLKSIFTRLIIDSDLSNHNEIDYVMTKKSTLEILIEKLREYIEGKPLSDIWKDVYTYYTNNSEDISYIINSGIDYKNVVENIKNTDIDKLYGEFMKMSVSKLENYASCPFKFFMDFGIKPIQRKELKVEYYDIGNIFHECIEKFTNEIIEKKLNIKSMQKVTVIENMESCIEQVLKENSIDNNALEYNERNKYIKDKIKRLLDRAAWTMISQLKKGNFKPEFTEYEIKKQIKEISKEIVLKGRIDRIDVFEDGDNAYVNIIDYKSAKKDISLSDVINGLQLQLFVYLSSIIEGNFNIEKSVPKIGGVFYFNIDDPLVNGDATPKEIYEEEILKELSLKGYVVEDMNVISNIDEDFEKNRTSDIIPVKLKADNTLSKTSKTLNYDEYKLILDKVEDVTKKISQRIINGEIEINPYKKDDDRTPCSYCDYKTICQFDPSIDGNKYRSIKNSNRETIISELMLENESKSKK
ncbi:exodeoxyribonuclease V subunit gamma [Sedimentibacter sp. zth1]|uniref:PD-(D/E)XK nuclease family protein n=1 Tax=Sedimentibacter sp. zth1 TaxID=2816908 RepID=UPI001A928D46|nr:PD-(D/E)XK nuclease family protein [Sedimentibacter sp. zth1]QSX06341.1 exodeoxyribonuclease V subunit gamma [Sedimentibacter sp. zth1]